MGKKRNLSVFDAIQELESEDVQAESQRRKRTTADAQRAQAAQSQTKIYNHLVECRILFQRAMTSTPGGNDDESAMRDQCDVLLETLLQARHQLTGGDKDERDDKYSDLIKKDSSGEEVEEILESEYDTCREQWKHVLNRRHKDLKLHAGLTAKSQFRVMDSSFWEQVEATVEYEQLRENDKDEKATFEDSKVYQQLLKDFVATSSAAASGSDSLRKASKKSSQNKNNEVDRRASKGRKIRYKEIPKLVNFTFPLSRPNNSNLDQDEWFQSLFGGAGSSKKS
jgi:hypothetical protein